MEEKPIFYEMKIKMHVKKGPDPPFNFHSFQALAANILRIHHGLFLYK